MFETLTVVVDPVELADYPAHASREPTPRADLSDLGSIYQEHFEMVWRGLRRLGVPRASVDDATQDVFLVVHRRLHEFEGRSALRSWIFGIAIHVARYYRRAAARFSYDTPEQTLVDETATDPSEHLEDLQALRLVYAALDRLSEAQREVFVLCDVEELTAPQVAALLKIPENTVYSRLRHARTNFENSMARIQQAPRRLP